MPDRPDRGRGMARSHNALVAAARKLRAAVSYPLRLIPSSHQLMLATDADAAAGWIDVVLGGTASPYTWSEIVRGAGSFTLKTGGRTSADANAYEVNNQTFLGGQDVRLWPGGGPDDWIFNYHRARTPCAALLTPLVTSCHNQPQGGVVLSLVDHLGNPVLTTTGAATCTSTSVGRGCSWPVTAGATYTLSWTHVNSLAGSITFVAECGTNDIRVNVLAAFFPICITVTGCYPGVAPGSTITLTTVPSDTHVTPIVLTGTVDAAGDRICFDIPNPFTGNVQIAITTGDGCGTGADLLGPFVNACDFIDDRFAFPSDYPAPKSAVCSGCVGEPTSTTGCDCNGWWLPRTLHYSDNFGACNLSYNGTGAWTGGYSFLPSKSVTPGFVSAIPYEPDCCIEDVPPASVPVEVIATCEQVLDIDGNAIGWRFDVTKNGYLCDSIFNGTGPPCVDHGNCMLSTVVSGLTVGVGGQSGTLPMGCGPINATGHLSCDPSNPFDGCCPTIDLEGDFILTS